MCNGVCVKCNGVCVKVYVPFTRKRCNVDDRIEDIVWKSES